MFAVGVTCALSSSPDSTCEANSHFEEEMASTFGEEKSLDTHFYQWLVTISLHSTFASNISNMYASNIPSQVIFQTCTQVIFLRK